MWVLNCFDVELYSHRPVSGDANLRTLRAVLFLRRSFGAGVRYLMHPLYHPTTSFFLIQRAAPSTFTQLGLQDFETYVP